MSSVVYAEMQARQNLQGDMMDLRMRRLLYPEDDGFRSETGGLMENLRVLTAERIREFHREMYQPKNMRLILIGEVDHSDLLDVLDKFEDDIVDSVRSLRVSSSILDLVSSVLVLNVGVSYTIKVNWKMGLYRTRYLCGT